MIDVEIEDIQPSILSKTACLTSIKQEPIDTELQSDINSTHVVGDYMDRLPVSVKTEPLDGDANSQLAVASGTCAVLGSNVTVTKSVINLPISQTGALQTTVRPTLTSSNCQTFLITSPATPASQRPAVLKPPAALTATPLSLLTSNLGLTPCAPNMVNGVLNHVKPVSIGDVTRAKPVVSIVSPKLTLAGQVKNTALETVTNSKTAALSSPATLQTDRQQKGKPLCLVNQTVNSNVVFLKCVDNQGKTILIPQQVCSAVQAGTEKSGNASVLKARSQPVIPVLNLSSTATTTFISTPKLNRPPATAVRTSTASAVVEPLKLNQPVFIKQENCASSQITNFVLSNDKTVISAGNLALGQTAANVKLVSGFLPSQNVANTKSANAAVQRSHLKVTSQGLIQVQNMNNRSSEQKVSSLIKPGTTILPAPTPILLQNSTNKVVRGKSLLTNLSFSQGDKSLVTIAAPFTTVAGQNRAAAGSVQAKISSSVDSMANTSKVTQPAANHFLIVPVSSQQTVVSATETKSVNSTISSASGNVNSGKLLLDMKSQDKKMLIVVQNDLSETSGVTVNPTSSNNHCIPAKSVSSLLIAKPQTSLVTSVSSVGSEMPVTISSTDQKQKHVILVQDSAPVKMKPPPSTIEKEKKIIVVDPKQRKPKIKPSTEVVMVKPLW